ncbi:MAG: LptF/LptG family permease [Bacteroidota bacterium]|nr:LptF/LptG family permease [Bacteroidota bacterium]
MKLLDRYIIKKFLSTFIFSIILIISLAIVIDLTEKMDDFIAKKAPLEAIVFDYYMNFIPFYTNLFMFLFIFISVVFFTSKMAGQSEIIAMLSGGVSFKRLMYPYFVSAFILAVFSFILSNFIIPSANTVRLDFENTYVNGRYYNNERNIHKQIEPGVFIYMESFKTLTNTGYKFSIEQFDGKKLQSKLMAKMIRWKEDSGYWEIRNYRERIFTKSGEILKTGVLKDTVLKVTPEDFKRRETDKMTLNYYELNELIADKQLRGETDTNAYILEKYQRMAFPFSSFILTLIGVSVASKKSRGGTGLNLGIGLLISFAYIFFMQISAQFSLKGNLSPILSAWIPNILFAVVAVILYKKAPK